ncbi:restriction endonuclease S subunit [Idiomarina aquatica]|uniref:Restriction endonuclease S subunit n=1 Tax=Idiomarina aquatica TaxID=1327752 RepID=A0A4R6P301_9GAMM|nr:restriction endonuclease subunit S [Idiomarina aquatica]TDP32134.1 restriction endonuclease S subunit [Idiomarina aquatica]
MSLGYIGENIPAEWAQPLLTDLVKPKQWKTIPTKDLREEGYVVYGANGKIGFYNEFTHENPTLMITCRGATCGNLHISEPYSYINGNAMALDRQQVDLIGVNFLRYALEARGLTDTISGSAQPQITRQGLSNVRIPLPPLAEQKVIADKLENMLAKVETTKARIERIPEILKTFRQSVLAAAVSGKLTEDWRASSKYSSVTQLPISWQREKASDVCEKVQSGSTPRNDPFSQNGTVPFLKVYNIVDQKIDFDYKPQFVRKELHNTKLKRSIGLPNDVVMNIVGPPLGKVAILTNQYPEWNLNQAITLFRPNAKILNFKYLYFVLCEGELVRAVMPDTKGSVGQVNISLTQCREALIPVPTIEEQTEIVRRVEDIFSFADNIEQKAIAALERVNNLTQSILAKAFRGELTADWREANPDLITGKNSAESLLRKITAEQKKLLANKPRRRKRCNG